MGPPRVLRLAVAVAFAALAFAAVSVTTAGGQADPDDCPGGKPTVPDDQKIVWSEPQCLSSDEHNGEVPQVAIADDGSAIAVWRQEDSRNGTERVQFSTRKRGENFTPAPSPPGPGQPADPDFNSKLDKTFLSSADHDAGTHIRLAMNKAGDAIVVWEEERVVGTGMNPAHYSAIMSAYKPHDGDFGPAQTVIDQSVRQGFTSGLSFVDPEVGIDGTGRATVIYHSLPGGFGQSVDSPWSSQTRPAGASGQWPGPDHDEYVLNHDYPNGEIPVVRYNEAHASLAVNEAGDRVVSITQRRWSDGTPENEHVYRASMSANATSWAQLPISSDSTEHHSTLAAARGDSSIAEFTEGNEIDAFGENFLVDFGGGPGGTGGFGFPDQINDPYGANTTTSGAALDIDSTAGGLALWSDGSALRANYRNPGAESFSGDAKAEPIPGNADGDRSRPDLAAGKYDDDTASELAAFQQKTGDDESVQAAVRKPGEGEEFLDPVRLSVADGKLEDDDVTGQEPFSPKDSTGPQVAENPSGEGVVAWSGNDGQGNNVVNVSLLTPKDDTVIPPPPPPPPRPKPAVSSPIQLARPLKRDQATVLVAKVPNGVTSMRWSFGTKNEPPIEAKVVNGKLQNAIRIRLPNTSFRARLHTEGSDGSHDYSRTFSTLGNSSSSNSKQVARGIGQTSTPPVFAVSRAETLIGDQAPGGSDSCSPTTIWSGQQKMAGCFKPIEGLDDIPDAERGAIHEVADQLDLDQTKKDLMDKATEMTDGYVAQGKVLLNDTFPVDPSQASSIVSIPQAKSLVSAKAELPVGSATYDPKNGFNLKLDPTKAKIPLGKLPKPPPLPKLGGLEIVGDWDVDLDKQEAKITASVVLPKEITKAGIRLENEVKLRATPDKVIIDNVRVGPADVDIGGLKVTNFKLEYTRDGDQWDGQGKACVISGACLDMSPPNGHVTVKNGGLAFAGASVIFPPPGIPLFTGVDLNRIGFGIGTDPTRMIGSAGITALQLVDVDGRLVLAFPSSRTPFILRRDEVGNDFPDHLYGTPITRTTIGMTGHVGLKIPETDDSIEFGHAYLLYEYPGYVSAGGGFDLDLVKIVQLRGGVSADLDVQRELFNFHGDIEGCLLDSDDLCGSAVANVSHGPNKQGGAGACIGLLGVHVGGGVQWARVTDPFIWPFDGCKWSKFKLDVQPSAAQAARIAAAGYPMDVRPGAPDPVLKLYGQGGAPSIRVHGPGGQLDAPSSKGMVVSADKKIRVIRFKGNKFTPPFTVVGLQGVKPGHYSVDPLPGSAPITKTARATNPPNAKVTGRVTGKGRARVLHYDVLDRDGQRVTFSEVTPEGGAKRIGAIAGGGRGKIKFRSAPGGGRRKVVAQFELSGIPAERRTIASFRPLSMKLARPKHVRIKRLKRGRMRVSWRRVKGATRYELLAKLSGRRMVYKRVRTRRATLKIPRWRSGRIYVRAIDDVRQSRLARSKRFRARGKRPSPFRKLYDCRVGSHRVVCAPSRKSCGGRRATLSAGRGRTLGTKGDDVIVGTAGNDRINGRGGDDIICGGGGNDRISGGSGRDRITGDAGNDRINGDSGADKIRGGSGRDRLIGGPGDDLIIGGVGRSRDVIYGGPGADRIEVHGRRARARVNCGAGRDRVILRHGRTRRCELR